MTDDTPRPEATVEYTDTPPTSPAGRPLLATLTATSDDTDETVELHVYLDRGMSPARALLTAARLLTYESAVDLAVQADPVGLEAMLVQARAEGQS